MSKLLFLEGPIQTGKSTLIRNVLETLGEGSGVAGFISQRLTAPDSNDGTDDTVAFRIAPAGEPLTRPVKDIISWPNPGEEECLAKGVFKYFDKDGVTKHPKVFQGIGLSYLTKSVDSSKLILLDEIGGHELDVPEYRKALYEVLASGKPCIGVIKHPESTKRMDAGLVELNAELHRIITDDLGGRILYFDRNDENTSEVIEAITEFVKTL